MDTWGVQSEVGAGKDKCDSLPATCVHAHAHTRLCPDLSLLLPICLECREQQTFSSARRQNPEKQSSGQRVCGQLRPGAVRCRQRLLPAQPVAKSQMAGLGSRHKLHDGSNDLGPSDWVVLAPWPHSKSPSLLGSLVALFTMTGLSCSCLGKRELTSHLLSRRWYFIRQDQFCTLG